MKRETIEKLVITFTKNDVEELLENTTNRTKDILKSYFRGFVK